MDGRDANDHDHTTGNNELNVTLVPAVTVGTQGPKGDKGDPGPQGARYPGVRGYRRAIRVRRAFRDRKAIRVRKVSQASKESRETGATGATGAMGATGAPGPPGPSGTTVLPAAPPPPYSGEFLLSINGAQPIPLVGFAGCFDKELGVEYEDCHFETERFTPELLNWFDDSVNGAIPQRTLTVYQVDLNVRPGQRSRCRGSCASSASHLLTQPRARLPVTASFVVVPSSVASTYHSTPVVTIAGRPVHGAVERQLPAASRVAATFSSRNAVSSIRTTWEKVPQSVGRGAAAVHARSAGHRRHHADRKSGGAEPRCSIFDQWLADAATGAEPPRTATLEVLNPTLTTTLRTITLQGLTPKQFLPFATGSNASVILRAR